MIWKIIYYLISLEFYELIFKFDAFIQIHYNQISSWMAFSLWTQWDSHHWKALFPVKINFTWLESWKDSNDKKSCFYNEFLHFMKCKWKIQRESNDAKSLIKKRMIAKKILNKNIFLLCVKLIFSTHYQKWFLEELYNYF